MKKVAEFGSDQKTAICSGDTALNLTVSNMPWLEERIILLGPTGSYAYGTNTEDSDKDFKGICVPPEEYYLGLESFNEYSNTGGKNFKNTKDDVDVTIIHINKFVKDALEGVPNNIEMLFLRPADYIKMSWAGQLLVDNRHLFLSKRLRKKFGGYAYSQIQKLKVKNLNGSGRQDLISKYGYDTKFFMQAVRLLTSAIEIVKTEDFSTYRQNSEELLKCRNGYYSFEEALTLIELYDKELIDSTEKSKLPEVPDYHKVNNLLMEINRKYLNL